MKKNILNKDYLDFSSSQEAIKFYGNPILNQRVKLTVKDHTHYASRDEDVNRMYKQCVHHHALGIAANQMGIDFCAFFYYDGDPEYYDPINYKIAINPVIVEVSDKKVITTEGCLSFPHFFFEIERAKTCLMRAEHWGQNTDQTEFEMEGLQSIIVQHEIDHLMGKTMADHLNPDQAKDFMSKWYDTEYSRLS